jgi:hypothetical protein
MKTVLDREITGEPVLVSIRGTERPLAYPMHAVILYKQKTGDSLFVGENWAKIELTADPERWLACLWAGLHVQQPDKSWKSPFTLDELGALIAFDNAGEISLVMAKALKQYLPKAEDDPKTQAPADEAGKADPTTAPSSTSTKSTLEPVAVSA